MRNAITALWGALLCVLVAMGGIAPANAQTAIQALVVTTCGTPLTTYTAGRPGAVTLDTTGTLCTAGGGGGGGGLSITDQAAFTQGTSKFTPGGGEFNDTTTLSSGQQGMLRLTTKRAQIIDVDTTGNAAYAAWTAPIPCLAATAFNTNSYSNAATAPGNCNLNGGLFVDLAKNLGPAGTANAGVITVQGIASMTKLLVTPDSVALPANQSVNVSQVNGVTTLTGTGATGTGAQRVTVSTDQATNAGAALVKGGVGTVNGGSTYQHVAASQTGAVLQTSTGAIGDYLSHCVIYPVTTAAGSVTVFDNTNAAATNVIEFATGTLSNLAPIAIPVGAVSTAGAWKVTTGANETVVCYGKFSEIFSVDLIRNVG